jgi:hypothetical protein
MGFAPLPNTFSKKNANLDPQEEQDWQAQQSPSATATADFASNTVYAPTDSGDHAVYERALINASVATSKDYSDYARKQGIPQGILQSVDRARVAALLSATHHAANHGYYDYHWGYHESDEEFAADLTRPDQVPPGALDFYLKSGNVLAYFDLLLKASQDGASANDSQQFWAHADNVRETPPADEKTQRLADAAFAAVRAVGDDFHTLEPSYAGTSERRLDHLKNPELTERVAKRLWDTLKTAVEPAPKSKEQADKEVSFVNDDWEHDPTDPDLEEDEAARWCDVEVLTPPLTMPATGKLRGKSWRLTDAGAYIRRPERHLTDGRVFGHRRKRPSGGAVVIDCSGSMGLSLEQIEEIMTLAPGVNIATYCSDSETGYLTIVARNGKRAAREDLKPHCGGNGIDGPALRWVATQPGPRIWVSDAGVTGRHDCTSHDLLAECEYLQRQHSITRYHSMDALIEARKRGDL